MKLIYKDKVIRQMLNNCVKNMNLFGRLGKNADLCAQKTIITIKTRQ